SARRSRRTTGSRTTSARKHWPACSTSRRPARSGSRRASAGAAGSAPRRRDADAAVRLQFRLSGDGGGDWWVLVRGTDASRHAGVVDDPDATLEADVADWHAGQAGDLGRLQAVLDGKLKISGDLTLFMLHETTITRLSQET